MRISFVLLLAAALPASAQVRVLGAGGDAPFLRRFDAEAPRVAIGVTTTSSARSRDTLGVLVTSVRPDSPADKAGVGEGDRIASINGVSLKLSPADVGADEMAGAMSRRLSRELEKLKVGDDVELRLYSNGQNKTVRVKTVSPEDLSDRPTTRRRDSERASLGIGIGTTGSARDTLGVFVMSVTDDGPAAKAGIEEGARIASINGVDLRGRHDADEDEYAFRTANVGRLERELGKVKPGDDVDLRVYYNGQYKNVKAKTVALSTLPRRGRTITVFGGDNVSFPAIPPVSVRMPDIRIGFGNRVVW
jgi:C-terminal processing protease CtpA/Prc